MSHFISQNAKRALRAGLFVLLAGLVSVGSTQAQRRRPLEQPYTTQTLQRFLERVERERIPYKLSLGQLAQDCLAVERSGGQLPNELRYLRGFNWFFGYLLDREKQDVYLLGFHDPELPPLDIDCLVTAIRSAYTGQTPSCSLDPHPNPKLQKSVVRGVPWNTRWAEIMIEADYDMKKICQGHLDPNVSGLKSWTSLRMQRMQRDLNAGGKQENRWWFNRPNQEIPRTLLLDESGDLVIVYRNPVVVMTEENVNGKFGTGKVADEAKEFADAFTRNMPLLARKYKSIGELYSLYRTLDVMVHLRRVAKVYPTGKDYWLEGYKHPYAGPPEGMPTLTRVIKDVRFADGKLYNYRIWGGVRMPIALDKKTFRVQKASKDLKRTLLKDR